MLHLAAQTHELGQHREADGRPAKSLSTEALHANPERTAQEALEPWRELERRKRAELVTGSDAHAEPYHAWPGK